MERPDPNFFPRFNITRLGGRVLDFAFHTPHDPETAYPSDHRRLSEPSDGEAIEPNLYAIGEVSDQLRFEGV